MTKEPHKQFSLVNRKAFHEYLVISTLECGLELRGTEVKSIRASQVSFAGAYGNIEAGELWLIGMHVAEYSHKGHTTHESLRKKKLLVTKRELHKLSRQTAEKGLTLIPLKLYEKSHRLKLELGVCRGKRYHDKRQTEKEKTQKKEMTEE